MTQTMARSGRVLLLAASLMLMRGSYLSAQQNPNPALGRPESFAVSQPLRDLAKLPPPFRYGFGNTISARRLQKSPDSPAMDPVEQTNLAAGSNFSVGLNFLGLGNGFPDFSPSADPPDTSMAVGDTQVVQWAQTVIAVFDKSSGQIQAGPILGNTIWSSLGGSCADSGNSELIVQWDKANHRWLLAANTLSGPPYNSCVAVSTGPDALGTYYLYQFSQGSLIPDSPKWSIWSNGYYQTQGEFSGTGFVGPKLCAYNSAELVVGDGSAEQICFLLSPNDGLPLAADIDSTFFPPPSGEDEFFISLWDATHLSLYSLHPNYQEPQDSTVTGNNGSQLISVPAFNPACNGAYGGDCVPQKDVSNRLQVLGDRLMYRLAYWEDSQLTHVPTTPPRPAPSQHWYVLHDATASGGNEGPRWYEFTAPLRAVPVTSLTLFQSGTFAPDSNYRWMGSIARDKKYDILLGYSESSSSMYPSIAITGRTPNDPLGTMEDELTVIAGTGAQQSSPWGNYSVMRIDQDGCTFWYVTEYYMVSQPSDWSTQIASAKFAGCQ
jgi:hypothetical protein